MWIVPLTLLWLYWSVTWCQLRLLCKFSGYFMDIYLCKFCKPHTKNTKWSDFTNVSKDANRKHRTWNRWSELHFLPSANEVFTSVYHSVHEGSATAPSPGTRHPNQKNMGVHILLEYFLFSWFYCRVWYPMNSIYFKWCRKICDIGIKSIGTKWYILIRRSEWHWNIFKFLFIYGIFCL